MAKYQIFDSLDRPCGPIADREESLHGSLAALREEEEEEPRGLTYAIGKIRDDGSITFEF